MKPSGRTQLQLLTAKLHGDGPDGSERRRRIERRRLAHLEAGSRRSVYLDLSLPVLSTLCVSVVVVEPSGVLTVFFSVTLLSSLQPANQPILSALTKV